MNRAAKPTNSQVAVESVSLGDVTLLNVSGLVDERFTGFGSLATPGSVVIDVSGVTRMTSFGVRQWLKATNALPKRIGELFLLGCPTFFVDQLNMVLNFGGGAKVLTVVAPYTCMACGVESGETIDVLAERTNLANGAIPEKQCARCGGKLEFDESPESYFAFVNKYGALNIESRTAEALASRGLYSVQESAPEKPPRIIKLVQDAVTYFRIIGRIGSLFRARPLLVGAEGEVVLDLHEVESYDETASHEWRRLLKNLSTQVTAVTLVDVRDSIIPHMGDTLTLAQNIVVASILVRRSCASCGETSTDTEMLHGTGWPLQASDMICECGGVIRADIAEPVLAQLEKTHRDAPEASMKVIGQRAQLLARALNDAQAQTSDVAVSSVSSTDDAILGKYKIVRRLPASPGAIADAFLAKQVGIGGFEKPVVLKKFDRKLLEERQQSIELLLDEVKSAGRLTHPNIVQTLDVGEVDGALYVAVEYVHGQNLSDIIATLKGPMPVAEAMHIAREVAHALDHAVASTDMAGQQLQVVHGDVGPHNILISYDGAVKVLDFGVMMAIMRARGDAQYTAPESAIDGTYEQRSDVFSLGIVLYELCTGTTPFPGSGSKSIVKKMRAGKFRSLEEVPGVPPELAELVARMIAFDIESRPASAQEVASELTDIARRNGLESSTPAVGAMITKLFGTDGSRGSDDASSQSPARTSSPSITPITPITPPRLDESKPVAKVERATPPRNSRQPSIHVIPRAGTQPAVAPPTSRKPSFVLVLLLVAAIAAAVAFVSARALL